MDYLNIVNAYSFQGIIYEFSVPSQKTYNKLIYVRKIAVCIELSNAVLWAAQQQRQHAQLSIKVHNVLETFQRYILFFCYAKPQMLNS